MKRNFKQCLWWSTIPPILIKRTITSHIKWLIINKNTTKYDVSRLEFQVMAWDWHKNVVYESEQNMNVSSSPSHPSFEPQLAPTSSMTTSIFMLVINSDNRKRLHGCIFNCTMSLHDGEPLLVFYTLILTSMSSIECFFSLLTLYTESTIVLCIICLY